MMVFYKNTTDPWKWLWMSKEVYNLEIKTLLYFYIHTYLPCSRGSMRIPLTHGYGCRKSRLIPFSEISFFCWMSVFKQYVLFLCVGYLLIISLLKYQLIIFYYNSMSFVFNSSWIINLKILPPTEHKICFILISSIKLLRIEVVHYLTLAN